VFNTLLIVGCAAMVAPMAISKSTVLKDIPFTVAASLLLVVLCMDGFQSLSLRGNIISRLDGIWLLLAFAAFMYYTFSMAMKGRKTDEAAQTVEEEARPLWKGVMWVVVGLACLVVGSNLFVDAAASIATELGMSKAVVGLTIVAGGTSLPELATSVVAARKGQSAIAIGNVIGSNVFNILLILGVTAFVSPMQIEGITLLDLMAALVSVVLVWLFSYTKYTVERWEGALLVLLFLSYMGWLVYNV
jgi:cation:H+ antiporter